MPYDSQIERSDASALIPEDVSAQIVQGITEQSTILRIARRLQNMPSNQTRMPVLAQLPTAYFVAGDTGVKQTTKLAWSNKYLNAEEIACIVPIPEAVLNDSSYDIWGEVRPRIVEEFGRVIDSAISFGVDAPASWPDDISTGAASAGNSVTIGTGTDLYDDILGEDGLFAAVEEDGYMSSAAIASLAMRGKLRGIRSADGIPIFVRDMQGTTPYTLDGDPIFFPRNGTFNDALNDEMMIIGDWSQLVYSIRQDMTWKLLDQAVLTDNAGNLIYNLPQQDMVALRAVMRLAWQLPNPITKQNPVEATRYPFARLLAA